LHGVAAFTAQPHSRVRCMATHPISIRGFLNYKNLAELNRTLNLHRQTLAEIKKNLPPVLADHCIHCVPKQDRLIVYVDTAAFASQLRFFAPTLIDALASTTYSGFKEIKIRIAMPTAHPEGATKKALPLTETAAIHVSKTAETCQSEEIRLSLLRLGRTLQGDY
jgi:hypothetical protein